MIDYSDTEAKLEEYSQAFDIYMDSGEMPPSLPPEDCIGGYMQQVIDSNPQVDGSDPTWLEVLKEGLMSYIDQLLKVFAKVQREAEEEQELIDRFERASLERKRQMWQQVCDTIRRKHSKFEVNIDGYSAQFATEDKDAVFGAMISDWRRAVANSLERKQHTLLRRTQTEWEEQMGEIVSADYEERRRIKDIVFQSPVLSEIVEIIGRAKEQQDEQDNIIYHYLPQGSKNGLPSEEIDSIETGNDLQRTLAVEFAMPDDLFFKRFATKELQILSPLRQRAPKKTEKHQPKPRPKKGPIIVGVDTSGSMYGKPEQIAKSLLVQLVTIARKEFRPCYLITFSNRIKAIDLGRSANILAMREFLDTRFTGGNGEEMLITEALRILETGAYEMADVLIISDFIFNPPTAADILRVKTAKDLGTRFYGLQVNSFSTAYDPILTRKWHI